MRNRTVVQSRLTRRQSPGHVVKHPKLHCCSIQAYEKAEIRKTVFFTLGRACEITLLSSPDLREGRVWGRRCSMQLHCCPVPADKKTESRKAEFLAPGGACKVSSLPSSGL